MPKARHTSDDLYAAASFACVRILPRSHRSHYVLDIRAKYGGAEPVVSILQALSQGMTAIFVGLLTSYLYDRTKTKRRARGLGKIRRLLIQQRRELKHLRRWIKASQARRSVKRIQRRFEVYEEIQTRVEKLDPSIGQAFEDAIKQLEKRGASALEKKVDEQFPKLK